MALTVVSFIVVMSILVFVHEFGHFIVAKRNHIIVDEFAFGFPPRLVKLGERDGTVYAINAIPFGGYVRLRGEDDPSEAGSFAGAPKLARVATLLAGPAMNILLAIVLFSLLIAMTGVPDTSVKGAVIGSVSANSPAAAAGMQAGDRIVAADGQPVTSFEDLLRLVNAGAGREMVFQIMRGGQQIEVRLVPRVNPPPEQGKVGISSGAAMRPATVVEALTNGVRTTWNVIKMTFLIPAQILREGRPIGDAGFMGPVGIAAMTGQVVRSSLKTDSIQPIIYFMALLSTALGLTNVLPIPGLDGGRLLFVLVEAVRRKRIEPMQEGMVHLIGLGLLLVLVAMLTVREVSSLISGTFPSIMP